jgi:hypothetical protein
MVVNGKMLKKLDLIAVIYIYDEEYFTVYRRYNSVYEIVIRDYNKDIYVRKDEPIYRSIQDILCLSDEQVENMRTENVVTFKYNMGLDTDLYHLEKMLWTDIQMKWYGLVMNMSGILNEYYNKKRKRMNDKSSDSNSDADSDSDSDNEEGELKEMNEVDDSTESSTESATESVLYSSNESTTDTSSDQTPTSLLTPIKLLRTPIIPYAPKKVCTYLSKKRKNSKKEDSEEENIMNFLSGKSLKNTIVYPDQEEEYKNYSNKRKWLEESNDSDSIVKITKECDDEGLQSLSSLKNIKYRKLYY